jgi:tRNA(Ile)-lysidine synthase
VNGAVDPAAVARFRADLTAVTGAPPDGGRRLGIAVSGGGDSLALLLLARAAFPGAVVAATVDHGLRPESAAEAQYVHRLCESIGVPHDILAPVEGFLVEGNLQERARGMRYMLLRFWAVANLRGDRPWRADWIATAHQQDDVAEGFLMRARRGAGVGGLAAMPASRALFGGMPGPALVRPLLRWSRAELAAIVGAAGVVAAEDASNVHPRFDRSRMRALLAATPELPPARLAMAARNLRDAEDALEWAAEREWQARHAIEAYETVWLDIAGLPHELRRRLVLRALDYVRFEFDMAGRWSGTGVDRLIATVDAGNAATLAEVLVRPGTRWQFTAAPPRRSL